MLTYRVNSTLTGTSLTRKLKFHVTRGDGLRQGADIRLNKFQCLFLHCAVFFFLINFSNLQFYSSVFLFHIFKRLLKSSISLQLNEEISVQSDVRHLKNIFVKCFGHVMSLKLQVVNERY